jgi:hypothetical protein
MLNHLPSISFRLLCIGICGFIILNLSACSPQKNSPQKTTATKSPQPTPTATLTPQQKLIGRWQGTADSGEHPVTFIFTSDNTLIILDNKENSGIKTSYSITTQQQPNQQKPLVLIYMAGSNMPTLISMKSDNEISLDIAGMVDLKKISSTDFSIPSSMQIEEIKSVSATP